MFVSVRIEFAAGNRKPSLQCHMREKFCLLKQKIQVGIMTQPYCQGLNLLFSFSSILKTWGFYPMATIWLLHFQGLQLCFRQEERNAKDKGCFKREISCFSYKLQLVSFVDTSLARIGTHVLHPASRVSGKSYILVFQLLW